MHSEKPDLTPGSEWWCTLLLGRWRQVELCEFKASLFYRVSSRTARDVQDLQRNPAWGGGVDLTVWSHLCTQYKEVKYKESFDINLRWEFFKKDPCLGTRTTMTPTVLLTSSSGRQKARRLREGWNEWGEGKAAMRKQSLLQQDAGSWIAAFSSIPSMATFSSVSSYQRWMESCWAKTMEKNHFLDFKNLVADAKSSMLGWGYNSVQGLLLSRHKSLGLILWTEKSKKWVER